MNDLTGCGADASVAGFGQSGWSRRQWLKGSLLVFPAMSAAARGQAPTKSLRPDEEQVVAAVRAKAGMAGLGDVTVKWSEHFVGVGDASPAFCAEALSRCESIAQDLLAHFRAQGFKLDFPGQRMTVVTLKDDRSYQAYSQEPADEAVGGHFDPKYNQLVIFDFRPRQGNLAAAAPRVNTFTLVHETIHLVCYNTGLLSRTADLPACVSEGLATYGELWKPPRDAKAFGAVNTPRLRALVQALQDGEDWIPVAKLMANDDLFREEKTVQLAYAEAWLLVHFLMKTADRLPKFREYLASVPKPGGALSREAYAEQKLGSLSALDLSVRRHARTVGERARMRIPATLTRARG